MGKLQDEAASLRKENQRLERSLHQAVLEERRAVEVARSQPVHADEAFIRLREECSNFENENNDLASELQRGRTELACMRGMQLRLEAGRSANSVAAPTLSCETSASRTPSTTHAGVVRTVNVAR